MLPVMSDSPRRPHTGRRRNDAAEAAILDATFRLLSGPGTEALTIDAAPWVGPPRAASTGSWEWNVGNTTSSGRNVCVLTGSTIVR